MFFKLYTLARLARAESTLPGHKYNCAYRKIRLFKICTFRIFMTNWFIPGHLKMSQN